MYCYFSLYPEVVAMFKNLKFTEIVKFVKGKLSGSPTFKVKRIRVDSLVKIIGL